MKSKTKNILIISLLMVITLPVVGISVIMPRIQMIQELTGEGDLKVEVYDLYFSDSSDDPELDAERFTLKILLDIRNPYTNRKIVIPRLTLELEYLGTPVGKIWTTDELILEPFVNDDSDSAGLLPLYIVLYISGDDSGLIEFINGLLLDQVGALGADLTLYLGDFPIKIDVLLGDVLSALSGGDTAAFDLTTIMGMLTGDEDDDEDDPYAIPEDYIMIQQHDTIEESITYTDFRALLNIENRSILTSKGDKLYFGAKKEFDTIHWENASNSNDAHGNGTYTWQYWNGDSWVNFALASDGTSKFTQTGDIELPSSLAGWDKYEDGLTEFWDEEYYYVRCNATEIDTCVNITFVSGVYKAGQSDYVAMDVTESHIDDYDPPKDSGGSGEVEHASGKIKPQAKVEYPDLDDLEIPLEKGFLKTDLELEDFFAANGVDFDKLIEDFVIDAIANGLGKVARTPDVYPLDEDYPDGSDIQIEVILDQIFAFIYSHNIDLAEFLLKCEFEFKDIFKFLGEEYDGWTAPDGIDVATGEDIYAPISDTGRYQNSVTFSLIILAIMFVSLGAIVPYYAQKKVEQTFIFKDIKNLDAYISKIKSEMEKGITADEIALLKTAIFKKKDNFGTKGEGEGK